MSANITIRKADGTFSIRAGGAVLGESSAALELSENGTETLYFPREDLAMALLDSTDKTTMCPHKGTATYFSLMLKSATLTNAAWSYETPSDEAAKIAGYIAFADNSDVTVEQI